MTKEKAMRKIARAVNRTKENMYHALSISDFCDELSPQEIVVIYATAVNKAIQEMADKLFGETDEEDYW